MVPVRRLPPTTRPALTDVAPPSHLQRAAPLSPAPPRARPMRSARRHAAPLASRPTARQAFQRPRSRASWRIPGGWDRPAAGRAGRRLGPGDGAAGRKCMECTPALRLHRSRGGGGAPPCENCGRCCGCWRVRLPASPDGHLTCERGKVVSWHRGGPPKTVMLCGSSMADRDRGAAGLRWGTRTRSETWRGLMWWWWTGGGLGPPPAGMIHLSSNARRVHVRSGS